MTAPADWRDLHPTDVIHDAERKVRGSLATLVAIEELREGGDDVVNWNEGTADDMLGHFDNLLACARALADQHEILLDYIRRQTERLEAGWKVGLAKERDKQRAGAQ